MIVIMHMSKNLKEDRNRHLYEDLGGEQLNEIIQEVKIEFNQEI